MQWELLASRSRTSSGPACGLLGDRRPLLSSRTAAAAPKRGALTGSRAEPATSWRSSWATSFWRLLLGLTLCCVLGAAAGAGAAYWEAQLLVYPLQRLLSSRRFRGVPPAPSQRRTSTRPTWSRRRWLPTLQRLLTSRRREPPTYRAGSDRRARRHYADGRASGVGVPDIGYR